MCFESSQRFVSPRVQASQDPALETVEEGSKLIVRREPSRLSQACESLLQPRRLKEAARKPGQAFGAARIVESERQGRLVMRDGIGLATVVVVKYTQLVVSHRSFAVVRGGIDRSFESLAIASRHVVWVCRIGSLRGFVPASRSQQVVISSGYRKHDTV